MKKISLSEEYSYLIDYNSIINNELFDVFVKYSEREGIKIIDVPTDRNALESNIRKIEKLVFEVTQSCNLRCAYCIFNGDYKFHRKVTKKNMSFDTARKGFDLIFKYIRNRSDRKLSIGFYGGEPVMCINFIENVVNYITTTAKNWDIKFTLTTNGTYIDYKILEFFKENNFSICISIDGPKEIHDEKRKYLNGRGTFDDVVNNIKTIKKFDTEFFKSNVMFNVVISKELPLIKTFNFFNNTKLVNENDIRFSFVNQQDTYYYQKYPFSNQGYLKNLNAVLDIVKKKVRDQVPLKPFEKAIYSSIVSVQGLLHKTFRKGGGACLFGQKLLIDCDGEFHLCDQINNKFILGNVSDGLNFERMRQLLKEYLEIERRFCSECEIRFLCKRCYITFARDEKFLYNQENCDKRRKNIIEKLKEYVKFKKLHVTGNKKRVEKFHQFVETERGPSNTAIFDFLNKNVYQVENDVILDFVGNRYERIGSFIDALKNEKLTITVNHDTWIPDSSGIANQRSIYEKLFATTVFNLEVEQGVDLDLVKKKFSDFYIPEICYFSDDVDDRVYGSTKIVQSKKDFEACIEKSRNSARFEAIDVEAYSYNRNFNSCWGSKIAITKDGKIRPCIYSEIIIGDFNSEDIMDIVLKAKKYWLITKDNVEKCKECELRYACFDCREIAYRKGKSLYAENPYCNYNPHTGCWNGEKK